MQAAFDDDELEVILITYNRSKFVSEWIERCVDELFERNIKVSVYDSSTDEETKQEIEKENQKHQKNKIRYEYITSELSVGHVVLNAMMKSSAKYVWVVGDSRCHNFEDLDEKVFPYIKKGVEHIVLRTLNNEENDEKIYTDKTNMLNDCLVSMTCTGFYIYKTSIFDPLKKDETFRESCLKKYDDNYGFTWMGYFLEVYARDPNYRTVFVNVPVIVIEPEKKIKRWNRKFFKCWCDDLCNVVDGISQQYYVSDDLLKSVWNITGFDMAASLYKNCKDGVLNSEIYQKYNQILGRVSNNVGKIESFAHSNKDNVEEIYEYWRHEEEVSFITKFKENIQSLLKKCHDKKISIYGAGRGGVLIQQCLKEYGILIKCFYDANAEKIGQVGDTPVNEVVGKEIDLENEFIIISLMGGYTSVKSTLMRRGVKAGNIYYAKYDNL